MRGIFTGRSAVVVGGSGGIGAAVSRVLAEAGATLIVHGGASRDRLDATVRGILDAGGEARGFLRGIEGPRDAIAIHAAATEADIVVCAWGPFLRAPLAQTTPADWEAAALRDLAFPGALASLYIGSMAERGYGRLLFFGGTATDAVRGYATTAAYSAAKTGIGVLVKSIAVEYAGSGVSAVAVCPGFVDTEYLDPADRERLRRDAPGGRLLSPHEIAETAVSLLASETANGALVLLDAGLDLGRIRAKSRFIRFDKETVD